MRARGPAHACGHRGSTTPIRSRLPSPGLLAASRQNDARWRDGDALVDATWPGSAPVPSEPPSSVAWGARRARVVRPTATTTGENFSGRACACEFAGCDGCDGWVGASSSGEQGGQAPRGGVHAPACAVAHARPPPDACAIVLAAVLAPLHCGARVCSLSMRRSRNVCCPFVPALAYARAAAAARSVAACTSARMHRRRCAWRARRCALRSGVRARRRQHARWPESARMRALACT